MLHHTLWSGSKTSTVKNIRKERQTDFFQLRRRETALRYIMHLIDTKWSDSRIIVKKKNTETKQQIMTTMES